MKLRSVELAKRLDVEVEKIIENQGEG